MYENGIFGGYTRWAVVFLIIFVLFFLLVPVYREVCQTVPVA
jgi:cytochrome c oxidase assembly protein Cox11